MPGGIIQYNADDAHEFLYVSNSLLGLLGYSGDAFRTKFKNSFSQLVYSEDRAEVESELKKQLQLGNETACEYRIELADGSLKWFCDRGRLVNDPNGKRWFYVVLTDTDYLKKKYRSE